jgi:methylmalonyl-CoA mutase N-terminal domain/subunit
VTGKKINDSGIEIKPLYDPSDLSSFEYQRDLGNPGSFPFTRGIYPNMYRDRLWTMRQYAGYGTADATNARFKYLLAQGQTGLSMAFDLPTQMGFDADSPLAMGEVGRVGVAISTLEDMAQVFSGIPLGSVSTSMTINATAAIILIMYQLVAEQQGVKPEQLSGTVQNDILKEYIARGTYIYPPGPSMRLTTDIFAYCHSELPSWNSISISGYHIREAGATAAQEVAFTLANAIAYLDAALAAGLDIDDVAPRVSFFWNAHNDLFEEVAKFRAARRMWANIVAERYHPRDKRSLAMRFHAQTGGSTLTAQQPELNMVRVTLQALAAILGGTQSLHTNAYDEALGLPTEHSARLALRTQQVIAFESGVTNTVDPLAGSYYLESLTNELETKVETYLDEIAAIGGAVAAIESGYQRNHIEQSAYEYARSLEDERRILVGVNRFADTKEGDHQALIFDEDLADRQIKRVKDYKANRDEKELRRSLEDLKNTAQGTGNLCYRIRAALEQRATLGEIAASLREVFGTYSEIA